MPNQRFEVISFDAEGTLVTPRYSELVWLEVMPEMWAKQNHVSPEEAKAYILKQYDDMGDHQQEWYDLGYWFHRLGLSDPEGVLDRCRHEVELFYDVHRALAALQGTARLVVCSGSAREFLDRQLAGIRHHFEAVFSSISDYDELKSPFFYQEVCRSLGINPKHMVHVGDSREFDCEVPQQLGITAFHLDRKRNSNANGSVRDLVEFAERLKQLSASSQV